MKTQINVTIQIVGERSFGVMNLVVVWMKKILVQRLLVKHLLVTVYGKTTHVTAVEIAPGILINERVKATFVQRWVQKKKRVKKPAANGLERRVIVDMHMIGVIINVI